MIRGLRVKLKLPKILLIFILGCMFLMALGWRPAAAQEDVPAGCGAVYAATTRGGATSAVIGGGSCDFFYFNRGDEAEGVRIIDGDTIVISDGRPVRYVGIDLPEIGDNPQFYGPEATTYNSQLLKEGKVRLEKDVSERDTFGRLLRFVYVGGILVNAELIREGYARSVFNPPDTRHAKCFIGLEEEAREAGRGMWGSK